MTNEELKALCESNARAIAATNEGISELRNTVSATTEQQARHTDEIDTLLGAVSSNEVAIKELIAEMAKTNAAIAESNQRFDVLRDEAIADRRENRELWNDAMTQADADRAEYREKFDRAMARADADRARADDRHTAQMEVIQTLLLELTKSNGNINTLRDRVDTLEQAS
jgi:chromosome segregation ATPase